MTERPTPDLQRYRMMIADGLGLSTEGVTKILDYADAQAKEIEELRGYIGKLREALKNLSLQSQFWDLAFTREKLRLQLELCTVEAREALALEMPGSNNNEQREKS